jgi:preprotein translocase subunit SecG
VNTLILTIHIVACICLVGLVLLQSGSEGMGVIFGGSSSTFFGSSGAGGLLSKLTVTVAIVFFLTSLSFAYLNTGGKTEKPGSSVVLEESKGKQESSGKKAGSAEQAPQGRSGSGQAGGDDVQ